MAIAISSDTNSSLLAVDDVAELESAGVLKEEDRVQLTMTNDQSYQPPRLNVKVEDQLELIMTTDKADQPTQPPTGRPDQTDRPDQDPTDKPDEEKLTYGEY